jgi:hypothetical protein
MPKDVVGHAAFNALSPLLLTVSGSRHFAVQSAAGTEAIGAPVSNDSGMDSGEEDPFCGSCLSRNQHLYPSLDATLRIWDFTANREIGDC